MSNKQKLELNIQNLNKSIEVYKITNLEKKQRSFMLPPTFS